ncbi:hypothetical protein BHF71_00130 [Vulcanibacillus modesticaldus]|uniref:Metal-binding protein n=1 Tax=Vulcanibacillus modesticaldus TaxID=337097 RepID=A0A1D2YXH1_9BACI|nr:DUF177 domain-containing protein [Vulcanibacillus modesticaldus]OEG00353.1 hypothetical protein BHF71_00130 [Vulcanibacillus modesticaldus]
MKIRIWEIDNQNGSLDFNYTENLNHLAKEINQIIEISPVNVIGSASKMADVYTIEGKVKATIKLQCSRCLTPFDFHLESDFKEVLVPQDVDVDWEQGENIRPLESDEIDITSIVEEAMLLDVPYIPVCDEDCKGLCQVCGTNLNETDCECETETIDPRLAELAKWFDQDDAD